MDNDPLVTSSVNGFAGWLDKVRQVAERSWKSVLLISFIGIAVPSALASLTTSVTGVEGYFSPSVGDVRWLLERLPEVMVDLAVTLAVLAGVLYVISASFVAGVWVVAEEAVTGRRASVVQAFRCGFDRARSMWAWSVGAALLVKIGLICCFIPGIYFLYALSLFAVVAVCERKANPLLRSISLTHRWIGIAVTRVPAALTPYAIYAVLYSGVANTTFKAAFDLGNVLGTTTKVGLVVLNGIQGITHMALLAPAVGVTIIALFVTYAELRAEEGPLTAVDLRSALSSTR